MPPRGARGPRGGRGRGRGAARAGHSSASLDDAPSQAQTQDTTDGSDSTMQDAPEPVQQAPIDIPAAVATPDVPAEQLASSSRQSRTASATPSRAGGRFRPKNIRRDAAERARLEEERNRDLAVKIKAEEDEIRAEERRARRGRGRGDRGRGLIRRTVVSSGPFSSAAQGNNFKVGGSAWGGGRGGGAWGDSSSKPGFTSQNGEYDSIRYRPRAEHENRVDIDELNGIIGYGDDGRPIYSTGFRPVGLIRRQHEEAEVKVKTTAELEAEERQSSDDEELFVSLTTGDVADARSESSDEWHAAPTKNEVKVKDEPDPDNMDIDIADIPAAVKAPPSPETKKKPAISEEDAALVRRRKEKADKDPEFREAASALAAQLDELSFHPVEDGDAHQKQAKDDHVYLFQLPPILPPLVRPSDAANEDTEATNPASQQTNTPGNTKVKLEEGAEKESEKGWNPFSTLPAEGGLIGKLNVRKSGRVELDWGGRILNLGMGAPTEFLTTAIMMEQNIDLQNPDKSTGFACGIGQVEQKFVLAPVWDEEEDWDPSLEGIEGL